MCCLHKTHKVRLLILHDKNFLQEKAMPKVAELGRIFRIWGGYGDFSHRKAKKYVKLRR